ncbi:hypothetical protein ACFV1C_33310 [Streptomyces sp. NPDC059605]
MSTGTGAATPVGRTGERAASPSRDGCPRLSDATGVRRGGISQETADTPR